MTMSLVGDNAINASQLYNTVRLLKIQLRKYHRRNAYRPLEGHAYTEMVLCEALIRDYEDVLQKSAFLYGIEDNLNAEGYSEA